MAIRSVGAQKRSVVLVPLPYQGHMTPMLQLGTMLHSKGFSIIVAHTQFNSPNPSNHPEFLFLPLAHTHLSGEDTSFGNIVNFLLAINNNCKAPLSNSMAEMMKDQESYGQISCIIYDAFMYSVDAVAAHFKLPSIVLRTCPAAYFLSFHVSFQLLAENCFPDPESHQEDTVPDLHFLRFKDLLLSFQPEVLHSVQDLFTLHRKSSVAVIWNTAEELEHPSLSRLQQHEKVQFFAIGPFHKMSPALSTSFLKEDSSCMPWLDKQAPNSVLYISLGSNVTIDEKELEETAWGLANSGQPFLWVVRRPSSVNGSQWVERLPGAFKEILGERGHIVKWAPQKEVLAHSAVGGFWSHCGWNSSLESISEAVPMICRPSWSDQLVNARYLTSVWKVGLELEHVKDRKVIEGTIRRLMSENEGKILRQRVLDMKQKLEASMQQCGSSSRSLDDLTELIFSF